MHEPATIPPARPITPRLELAALLLLCAAALALRFAGLGWMLPHATEPDGIVLVTQVDLIERGAEAPGAERNWAFYPHLVSRLAALVHEDEPPPPAGAPLAEHLASAAGIHRSVRATVAVLSVLLVAATWALARRFLGSAGSLLAAALSGASVLDLWFAQQARPHAAAAGLTLLAVVLVLRLAASARWRDALLAGVALGLALAALQSALSVLVPLGVALAFVARTGAARAAGLGLAVVATALAVAAPFHPFLLAGLLAGGGATGVALEGGELELSGHVVYLGLFRGRGLGTVLATLADYEPWLSALAAAGLALGAARLARGRLGAERTRDLAIVLAHALAYFAAIALYERTYQRFVIPLVPYLACLAAYAAVRAGALAARLAGSRAAGAALAAALALPQVALASRLAWVRTREDTVGEAARWLAQRARPGERISFLPTLELPLFSSASARAANARVLGHLGRPWHLHQLALGDAPRSAPEYDLVAMPLGSDGLRASLADDPEGFLRGLEADWIVVEVYSGGRKPLVLNRIPPALPAVAERVARFSPDARDELDAPLAWQDDEYGARVPWALRLLGARATGPVIEIWRPR